MSFFGDLLHSLDPSQLFDFILGKFPALRKLLDFGKKIIEHFTGTFAAGVKLFNSAQDEFLSWKKFKEDVRFSKRVIQIETAISNAQKFIKAVIKAWKDILELIRNAGTKLETGAAAEITEAGTGIGLPIAVVNAIVIVVEVIDTVRNLIDTAQAIVDSVTGFRKLLQGDLLFLQQNNPRKTVKLDDGTVMKIRVGGLHDS